MTYELRIKRIGSMLPGFEATVTDAQASMIMALLKTDIPYDVFLEMIHGASIVDDYDSPAGAGEDVEAFRG